MACQREPEPPALRLTHCADLPCALTNATAFVVDSLCYVWGGRDSDGVQRADLWCYSPRTDSWQQLPTPPIGPRVRAVACVVDNKVYMGLGSHGMVQIDSTYRTDWWCFTPADGSWQRLCDYPARTSVGAVAMASHDAIYIAYGNRQQFERDVYRYDIRTDSWQQLYDPTPRFATYPPRAHSVTGTACQGRFFVGTGYFVEPVRFWAEMIVSGDSIRWRKCAPVPGSGRIGAAATAQDDAIYLTGGRHYGGTVTDGYLYRDILCYHPGTNRWKRIGQWPDGERENMIILSCCGRIYLGLGNDKYNRPQASFYSFEP